MRDVLVLAYHAVSPTWTAPLSVTPDSLREQLDLLAGRGYVGATFTEAVTAPPAPRTVAVTFDDGMRSVFEHAAPILRELGWPGTLYVPVDHIDDPGPLTWPGIDQWAGGPHEDELRHVTWDELRSLQDEGWEIGSHTCTHPHLTTLGDEALAEELLRSRETCEQRIERPCPSIAYPYGDVDERVVAATAAAGYTTAAGLPERPHAARRLLWPRFYVDHADTLGRVARRSRPAWRTLERTPLIHLGRSAVRLRRRFA